MICSWHPKQLARPTTTTRGGLTFSRSSETRRGSTRASSSRRQRSSSPRRRAFPGMKRPSAACRCQTCDAAPRTARPLRNTGTTGVRSLKKNLVTLHPFVRITTNEDETACPNGASRGREISLRFRLRGSKRMWYTCVRQGNRRENRLPRWLHNCWKLLHSEVGRKSSVTVSGAPSCPLSNRAVAGLQRGAVGAPGCH